MIKTVILIIFIMGITGIFAGATLAYANKKLAVEINPLIEMVEEILPKGQCGACGFAGCQAYAEAVVTDPDVSPDLCIPGKKEVAKKVAELTDKKAIEIESGIAHIKCSSPMNAALKKYNYQGINDCAAASVLHAGPKACKYGCVGLGSCVKICPFGALTMNDKGMPVVDAAKCTGCGMCVKSCPKNIIEIVPIGAKVFIKCNSQDKGAISRGHCRVSCIGCGLCAKDCKHNAIKVNNNLAVVDSHICIEKCNDKMCIEKCPTGAIIELF